MTTLVMTNNSLNQLLVTIDEIRISLEWVNLVMIKSKRQMKQKKYFVIPENRKKFK